VGKEPATVDPLLLDGLRDKPDQTFPVKLGDKTVTVSLKDIIYDAAKGDFKHPNTMTAKLMAGDEVLLEQEYYSVGGGFIEWKGYTPDDGRTASCSTSPLQRRLYPLHRRHDGLDADASDRTRLLKKRTAGCQPPSATGINVLQADSLQLRQAGSLSYRTPVSFDSD
jgi:hypothetical protein